MGMDPQPRLRIITSRTCGQLQQTWRARCLFTQEDARYQSQTFIISIPYLQWGIYKLQDLQHTPFKHSNYSSCPRTIFDIFSPCRALFVIDLQVSSTHNFTSENIILLKRYQSWIRLSAAPEIEKCKGGTMNEQASQVSPHRVHERARHCSRLKDRTTFQTVQSSMASTDLSKQGSYDSKRAGDNSSQITAKSRYQLSEPLAEKLFRERTKAPLIPGRKEGKQGSS